MKTVLLGCLVLGLIISSCTKDPIKQLTPEETRIYITNYDTSVRFSNYATFSIEDSVALISNNRLQGKGTSDLDEQFINAVAANLEQRGFQRVNASQNRSEEHTSELQSRFDLVCRLL